jgi:hypothetical protein
VYIKNETNIVNSDGYPWKTTSINVIVVPPSTPASASLSPANVAIGAAVTASWSGVDNAINYDVSLICTTNAGYNQARNNIAGTSATFTMNGAGTYKVLVVAKNTAGSSAAKESSTIVVHPNVTATFKDYDGAILKTQSLPYGGNASTPVAPSREGYTFQGWDKAFTGITSDTTVTATYKINQYTVKFFDDRGTLLKSQIVEYCGAATPPIPTPPPGEIFVDWDSREYELVKKDINIIAAYAWENPDLPNIIGIDSAVRNAARTGYDVTVRMVNYNPAGANRGRVIAALKTEGGKMVASETETYTLDALVSAPRTIFVPYPGVATTADVSVVGLLDDENTGVPLAEMATAVIDLGLAWSDWSTNAPPAGDYITESQDQYRYRDKSKTTNASSTLSGWMLYDTQVTGWSAWSSWQNSSISEKYDERGRKIKEVKEQTIPAQYKTQYFYEHWKYWNSSQGMYYYKGNSSLGGTYECITIDEDLPVYVDTSDGPAYLYGGTPWFNKRPVQTEIAAEYKQWRYRDAIYTYYFEKWGDWSNWQTGNAPTTTSDKEVETRTVHRFKSNDIKLTAYNYKRYKYQNLSNGNAYYTYDAAYADSMGYPGEWEYNKSYSELPVVATVDESIALHNGYGVDSWYRADVNTDGNVSEYVTYDTLEDTGGTERTVSGSINAPEKLATLLVFRKTNEDPTASQLEYVDQAALSTNGAYSFTFKTKEEPNGKTGDFLVVLAVEGGKSPVYIDTIEAPRPVYTVVFTDEGGTEIERQSVIEGQSAVLPTAPEKEGHIFVAWDENTTNVRKDLSVAAVYAKKTFNVVFVDWDNSDIDIREFAYGDTISLDNVPEKEGCQ